MPGHLNTVLLLDVQSNYMLLWIFVFDGHFGICMTRLAAFILQGRVVRKPISANPGLKVNREFNFFYIKVF